MSTSSASAISSTAPKAASTAGDPQAAFRNADFLKIMLSEVTNQSPLDPQDTSKLVENMQKLQELANTTYAKFRADVGWAQDLMGKNVSVSQQALSPQEKEKLVNKGLRPDVGYQQVSGSVEGFRVVDQVVYVSVKGKDYPVDQIRQIVPQAQSDAHLAEVANQMLGRQVVYTGEDGKPAHGTVKSVRWGEGSDIKLDVEGQSVSFAKVLQIGV